MSEATIQEAEIVPESKALTVRHPGGLPTIQDLEQQFELAVRQRELLSEYIKKQLIPGKHFYQRGTQKPSLAKEGAEIILLPHNLAPDYEQIAGPDSPPADGRPYQITVKCVLRRKGDSSSFVGSGIGSAGSEKQKRDGTYIHRQEDKYLCHNATLKMAQKSAMIAATINSTAASEFFTQDMDELSQADPEPHPETVRQAAKPAPKKPSSEATAKHLTRMLEVLKAGANDQNRQTVTEFFRKIGPPHALLPNEELSDLPLRFVPTNKEQMNALCTAIARFEAGDRAELPYVHADIPAVEAVPEAQQQQPEGKSLHGIVEAVSKKEGHSKKGAWTRYGIKIGEEWVNTFSNTLGKCAEDAKKQGVKIRVFYVEQEFGKDAVRIVLEDGTVVQPHDK